MKTHMATKVMPGMKNMFGLLPDKLKMKYYVKGISKVVVDMNMVTKPLIGANSKNVSRLLPKPS